MILTREDLIDHFFAMIRKFDRTGIDLFEVKSFFNKVSEVRLFTPPTVEFMTVLKTYRSILFHEFKRSLVPSTSMWFIANVSMDVGEALVSLGITDVDHLERCVKG
ncbi:hypothetical protein [Paenibacillus sp. N3.4]|uniref:hypothetical protein n=1 Tax=Paenibacillus sp. N3.4 TaxID=2603222 RepID=UPI0011CCAA92|nr:hypothetical protein [Paenibacillus sp. N3.4]TXK85807.1 hypothetical protein FU659_02590 [Paenibacillus sp. N3.4]